MYSYVYKPTKTYWSVVFHPQKTTANLHLFSRIAKSNVNFFTTKFHCFSLNNCVMRIVLYISKLRTHYI